MTTEIQPLPSQSLLTTPVKRPDWMQPVVGPGFSESAQAYQQNAREIVPVRKAAGWWMKQARKFAEGKA